MGLATKVPFPLQLVVSPLGGDDADLHSLGELPDGRQGLAFHQFAGKDLGPHLAEDLFVDRTGGRVGEDDFHGALLG